MERFHFHIHGKRSVQDRDGTELAHLGQARAEALKVLGQTLVYQSSDFWEHQSLEVRVTDAAGLTLFSVTAVALDAPASAPTKPSLN